MNNIHLNNIQYKSIHPPLTGGFPFIDVIKNYFNQVNQLKTGMNQYGDLLIELDSIYHNIYNINTVIQSLENLNKVYPEYNIINVNSGKIYLYDELNKAINCKTEFAKSNTTEIINTILPLYDSNLLLQFYFVDWYQNHLNPYISILNNINIDLQLFYNHITMQFNNASILSDDKRDLYLYHILKSTTNICKNYNYNPNIKITDSEYSILQKISGDEYLKVYKGYKNKIPKKAHLKPTYKSPDIDVFYNV